MTDVEVVIKLKEILNKLEYPITELSITGFLFSEAVFKMAKPIDCTFEEAFKVYSDAAKLSYLHILSEREKEKH